MIIIVVNIVLVNCIISVRFIIVLPSPSLSPPQPPPSSSLSPPSSLSSSNASLSTLSFSHRAKSLGVHSTLYLSGWYTGLSGHFNINASCFLNHVHISFIIVTLHTQNTSIRCINYGLWSSCMKSSSGLS